MTQTGKAGDNWWVFPGFEIDIVATGLDLPVNLAFVPQPDRRAAPPLVYVTELYGQVKAITNDGQVHTYAEGLLDYEPDHRFPGTGESGLIGICVEPRSGDLFLSMIYEEGGTTRNKVIRASSRNALRMDSSSTVIDGIPSVRAAHQIQALTIGPDGKLYVNLGDGMIDPNVAQDDHDLRGKVLRINLDGSIPEDNPTRGSPVYAKGLRNPFGAVWRKSDGALYISDNGPEQDDRIARVEPGGNYGWPETMRRNSLFVWEYCQAPTGIDFMQGGQFPPRYDDELFVALFGAAYQPGRAIKGKKIVKMKLNDGNSGIGSYDEFVTYVGDGPASPCGLAFGPDGLYFTDLHGEANGVSGTPGGSIYRVSHTELGRRGKMRVPDTNENWEKCICGDCPSINDCMKERSEGLFCARGKTSCQFERKGCICGECPVTSEFKLSGLYYCDAGAAE